ncbi:MAG: HAMP domain-containing sensor histidine kinase [Desulfobacterales bacterium]|nr:HAMP domain-containing sensor histidine kinase [Desulfobacterales bacterium]
MKTQFSIKTKIFLVILAPSLLLLLVIYLDYRNLNALGRSAELILSKNYKSIRAAQQIRQLIEENRNTVILDVFLGRKVFPKKLQLGGDILKFLNVCKDNITEIGEKHIIDKLFKKYSEYQALLSTLSENIENQNDLPGSSQRYYNFISLTSSFISDINELVLINEKAMEEAEQDTKRIASKALMYSIGLLIITIIFIAFFSHMLSDRLSRPLTRLARILSGVKEGSGQYPQIPVTTNDEIGFLTSEFNRLFDRLKVYDQLSQDKLTAEKLKVRQAEEAKARFIADLSHQLKTPMTSLSMSVGMLTEKMDQMPPDTVKKLLETTKEDSARLAVLINELVDITRLDGMKKPGTRELLNIENILHECLSPLLSQAEEKKIHLNIDVAPGLPAIAIDSLRFPWVIMNLLGNAIRYTDHSGQITFQVRKQEDRYYFICSDTGAGIEEKYLPKIFERFTQFSEREKSGTIGLGLAIVKEVVEQHGGSIRVDSKIGHGTTFTFWIPAN